MTRLPTGWEWSTLGELCGKPQYGWTTKADRENLDGLKFLRTTDITRGPIQWEKVPTCTEAPEDVSKYQLAKGDLVVSRAGSVGVSALIEQDPPPAVFASYLIRLRPMHADARYVKWFMQSPAYWRAIEDSAAGIALQNVNAKKLAAIRVPVAPADKQQQIVEAIEEQFSRLDAGVESLQRAKRNIMRLRAAALKLVATGGFLPQGSSDEPADALLRRIRRGKQSSRAREEGLTQEARDKLPRLPVGWAWALPDELTSPDPHSLAIGPFGSNLKVSDYTEAGVPLVFVRNIRSRDFGGADAKHVSQEKAAELAAHSVTSGDLLITKMGDPPGDAAIYTGQNDAIITADCIKLRPHSDLDGRFVELAVNSPVVRSQIVGITRGVAQKKVSLGRFRSQVAIPVAPLAEQRRIVAEYEAMSSVVDVLDDTLDKVIERSVALRRGVLHAAFSGGLTASPIVQSPQDGEAV